MNELVLDPSLDPTQDRRRTVTHPRQDAPPAFKLETRPDGIAVLTFDTPGTSANVLNEVTLSELDEWLDTIETHPTIKALIVRSAKDKVFVAGADLKSVRSLPPAKAEGLVGHGQEVIDRLARLPLLKIAAIHGACVGGGYELTLACDYRVASDDDSTRIGLPEVLLGLVPGWGGCTRLPRLLGLPKALDLILAGKVVKAVHALKLGMVDFVVPREYLEAMTMRLALKPETLKLPRRTHHRWVNTWPVRSLIAARARKALKLKTRGLYEAPQRALEVITKGIACDVDESLALERKALLALVPTSSTAHLIDLFFRKEAASKKPLPLGHVLPITDVAVVGAGVMGAGIAQWLASHGVHVTMMDISPDALGKGMRRINDLTGEALKRRLMSRREARETMDHISTASERVPLNRCQLIIEAATEDMALKKRIFADLASRCGPETILATNTSALSVAELAECVPHPERVIGMHFFNPVHRMLLVEVIRLKETNNDVMATAHGFVQRIGKVPLVVNDSPGFVVNRILMPYLMEAVDLFNAGHSPAVIDEAMLEFGMPMGPMRLLDEVGLDVALHVAATLKVQSPVLERMVAAGWLGKKSGMGFYDHRSSHTKANPGVTSMRHIDGNWLVPDDIQEHLALRLSEEAVAVLAEGVAENARDIDLAMVLGTGYAPFRGGPLSFINKQ